MIKQILLIMFSYGIMSALMIFFSETLTSILRKDGISLQLISVFYSLFFINIFRIFWTPVVEKYKNYRFWIISSLICLILILSFISFLDIKKDFFMLFGFLILLMFVASFLQISLDGFVYNISNKNNRGQINSYKMSAMFIGTVIGGGLGLIMYAKLGWKKEIFFFVSLCLLTLFFIFFQKEIPTNSNEANLSLKNFFRYFSRKKIWFFTLLTIMLPVSAFFPLNSKILIDIGWSLEKIGLLLGIVTYVVGAIFSFFMPKIMKKFGKRKLLIFGLTGNILSLILLFIILNGFNNTIFVTILSTFTYLNFSIVSIIMTTSMMDKIMSNNPALEYTMQYSIYHFGGLLTTTLSMFLAGALGYEITIVLAILLSFISVYLSSRVKI